MKQATFIIATFAIAAVGWFILKPSSQQSQVQARPGPPAAIDSKMPEHEAFRDAYVRKLANEKWVDEKSRSGARAFQTFDEERDIKDIRSKIAKSLKAPAGVTPVRIPRISAAPAIDGKLFPGEWDKAVSIPIGIDGHNTPMFAMSDGDKLYLAVDAPGDTTASGYDQCRFYFHLDITPLLVNERVHLDSDGGTLGGIRQTKVRWEGDAGDDKEDRWKKYPISDWSIFEKTIGATTADGHRQYEIALDLNESGIPVGTPFPARVEVEADPKKDANGKFKGRTYVGRLGAQTAPVWFVID